MSPRIALSPRQARTTLDLLTGAVVISVAFALAGLTWRIAGHAGTGAITVPTGMAAPATDIAPALALAPFGKASVEALQRTSLPLELKGVVAAVPASLSTAFISVEGGPVESFGVGARVSQGTIRSILRDRVVIENAGRIEALTFPDPTLSPEQRQAQGAQEPQGGAAAAPAQPANAASLLQRFDATPGADGLHIGDSPPPGLMPGDVIESINGAALNDPAAAAAAIQAAQANGNASVTVIRQGNRLTVTMPLR
ncbi:type II secretion system protein N [Sphingosinithalassobacter portus]|uniref:type II secretion system protein N n=1 Tax=Stakelama portus TaxID=2676234 RepID=UPI000D6DE722|nr:type II secretion system protein N [Sphingosinithalassobacter portus]